MLRTKLGLNHPEIALSDYFYVAFEKKTSGHVTVFCVVSVVGVYEEKTCLRLQTFIPQGVLSICR